MTKHYSEQRTYLEWDTNADARIGSMYIDKLADFRHYGKTRNSQYYKTGNADDVLAHYLDLREPLKRDRKGHYAGIRAGTTAVHIERANEYTAKPVAVGYTWAEPTAMTWVLPHGWDDELVDNPRGLIRILSWCPWSITSARHQRMFHTRGCIEILSEPSTTCPDSWVEDLVLYAEQSLIKLSRARASHVLVMQANNIAWRLNHAAKIVKFFNATPCTTPIDKSFDDKAWTKLVTKLVKLRLDGTLTPEQVSIIASSLRPHVGRDI